MAGEEIEGDFSSAKSDQVVGSRVVEGSVQSAVPARAPSWFEQDMPYEVLVGQIDHLVEWARARHPDPATPFRPEDPFNAAEWLAWHLQRMSQHAGEHQKEFMNVWRAWQALSYERFTGKQGYSGEAGIPAKNVTRGELELYVAVTKKPSLTLSPKAVTLLDAMAEVVGIPRQRGEATIDLTPFAHPADTPRPHSVINKSIIRRPLTK
jgi:hypothetical protein